MPIHDGLRALLTLDLRLLHNHSEETKETVNYY